MTSSPTLLRQRRWLRAGSLSVSIACTGALLVVSGASPAGASHSETAPSATGHVQVLTSRAFRPSTGGVHVVGEVVNNWNRVTSAPVVKIELLGSSGQVLGTASGATTLRRLSPGERGGFEARIPAPPAGYASYRLAGTTTPPSASVANHNFTVSVTGNTVDSSGKRTITGSVKNLNLGAASQVSVAVVIRDANRIAHDVDHAPVGEIAGSSGDIPGGGSASFRLVREAGTPWPAGAVLDLTAQSDNLPTPLPTEIRGGASSLITAGSAGTARGVVSQKGATGTLEGVRVELLARGAGETSFRVIRTQLSSSTGVVSWSDLRPTKHTVLYMRVVPTQSIQGSQTGQGTMKVRFAVSQTLASSGRTGYISGKVSPARAGQPIYLQQYVSGSWKSIAGQSLSSTSSYRFTITKTPGSYTYRIYKPSDASNTGAHTAAVILRVS